MGATATGGYRCCCGSGDPSFVLTIIPRRNVGELPVFKLRMPVASGIESSLCGYVARSSMGRIWRCYLPARFYRLVYRSGKDENAGKLSQTSARPYGDDVIGNNNAVHREERRLMATEESRQRYSLRRC